MSEPIYTVDRDANEVVTLWLHDGPDDRQPTPVLDLHTDYSPVFRAAVAVLAPGDTVCELIEKVIKDAYYRARDKGGTMHTAAEDARDAVLAALKEHATGGGSGE